MLKNRVQKEAKMEDVFISSEILKHISMLHGQINCHCIW